MPLPTSSKPEQRPENQSFERLGIVFSMPQHAARKGRKTNDLTYVGTVFGRLLRTKEGVSMSMFDDIPSKYQDEKLSAEVDKTWEAFLDAARRAADAALEKIRSEKETQRA